MSINRRVLAPLLIAALAAGACSSLRSSSDPDAHDEVTTSTAGATAPTSEAAGPGATDDTGNASATWPLVDAVPSHRKPGLLVRRGLDHVSALDNGGTESRTVLRLTEPISVFGIVPDRGGLVSFDRIELEADLPDDVRVWPFILADGALTRFVPSADVEACNAEGDAAAVLEASGIDAAMLGRITATATTCVVAESEGDRVVGVLDRVHESVDMFGVFATSTGAPTDIQVDWLALSDGTNPLDTSAPFEISLSGRDLAVAARSIDQADDETLDRLWVLDADGTVTAIDVGAGGSFVLDPDDHPGPIKLWLDDYGLEHYTSQGPWLDMERLSRTLEIDLTPAFTSPGVPPGESFRRYEPHQLLVWNGNKAMPVQEYEGLTFLNNLARADRDRSPVDSSCVRVGWLGGSFVEALQTRVDQKPAIIAEATLAARDGTCVEVITVAQDTFTVENHLGNATELVEEFGVELLVFSISQLELCRMDDLVYANANGVNPTTPIRWRMIDGVVVEPLPRRLTVEFEADPEFRVRDRCSFTGPSDDVERAVVEKLADLQSHLETLGSDVAVRFFNVKDVLIGAESEADGVDRVCAEVGVRCDRLTIPGSLDAPDDLHESGTRFLYRFNGDAHPTVRANQLIADQLATLISEAVN